MVKHSWYVLCMTLVVAGCSQNSSEETTSHDGHATNASAAEGDSLGESAPMPMSDECGSPATLEGDECGSPALLDEHVAAQADELDEASPPVFVPPLSLSAISRTQAQAVAASETEDAEATVDAAPAVEVTDEASGPSLGEEAEHAIETNEPVADAVTETAEEPQTTHSDEADEHHAGVPLILAPVDEGFTSLIAEDATLAGWQVVEGKIEAWQIDAGVLRCNGAGGGWLQTAEAYSDFVFRGEYRLSQGANTGIAVRFPGEGNPSVTGIEIQLLDETAEKYADVLDVQRTGSLYYLSAANAPAIPHPDGEWNAIEISCQGRHIQVRINGLLVNDVVINSLDHSPAAARLAARAPLGHIALQSYDTAVEFRGLEIRDLAHETESGLKIVDIAEGTGDAADAGQNVTVHYVGQLTTGAVFDDSYGRGAPVTVPIDRVILGWREGIRGMQVGGRRRLIVPPQLGYGAAGVGDVIPPNATLVFDVELIAVAAAESTNVETEAAHNDSSETPDVSDNAAEDTETEETNTESQDTSAAPTATPISTQLTQPPTREASQSRQMVDPLDVPNLFESSPQPEATEPAALPAPISPANEPQPLPVTNTVAPIAPASSTQLGPAQPLSGPTLGGPKF